MGERYLSRPIQDHLRTLRQMVFLTGPRQVGKTTLAKSFLQPVASGVNYFNWDLADHRRYLLARIFSGKERLEGRDQAVVVFDEIHKYPRWKNSLKGLFDGHEPASTHWIVTGSASLNVYRKGQDSLLGRHFTYLLAPFSVAELVKTSGEVPSLDSLLETGFDSPDAESREACDRLHLFGGFPEPLFRAEASFLKRWRTTRLDRLINQDLAAIELLRHLPLVEQLLFLLPDRVGSPLSLNGLRGDLEVHFSTVKHWMELLERVFYGFFVRPWSRSATRLLKKEAKWYLWDWSEIADPGARFENLVAVHLIKYVNCLNQLGQDELSLHYVRDKEKREVDFLICRKRKPYLLIECKSGRTELAPALVSFADQLRVESACQLVDSAVEPRLLQEGKLKVHLIPAASFLRRLV